MSQETQGIYLSKVTIKDFNCFQGEQEISFTRPNGFYQQWNVILGNNNTGKTTILRLLGGLSAEVYNSIGSKNTIGVMPIILLHQQNLWHSLNTTKPFSIKAELQEVVLQTFKPVKFNWRYFLNDKNKINTNGFSPQGNEFDIIKELQCYGYGISRKMKISNLSEPSIEENIRGLFYDDYELANAEEWLLQLDYGAKNGISNALTVLNKLKTVLTNGLLPDAKGIELKSELDPNTNSIKNYALFDTDYGKVRLKGLGYGYQATMAWVVDLAKKLFERYPTLDNPLTGAAIVLVDEIDLHLHPDWQRKIISHLSGIFPNVQFVVTAHSPLIVQSAENVNLIILEKGEDNQTHIRQEFGTFRGWTIEEILQDLMGLGDKTLSDTYLNLLHQFEDGLDSDNYEKAKSAYDELLLLLHPASSQRKLLKLQLGAIAPTTV
ncbi:MAG: AAA family ATPase [Spirosomataceae bacterium]